MSERAAYSRVYWSVIDDPKFDGIRDDDHHLATWLRLLLIADQSHPASANIPTGTRRASVLALAEAGLLDLGTGSRYRIHGLDAERERRRLAATSRPPKEPERAPDGTPTVPERDPAGIQTPGLRRDELRRDKTSQDDARESLAGYDGRADLEAFVLAVGRAPTLKQRRLLDSLLSYHDLTGPQWAADIILAHPDDPIGAVIVADKAYRAERIAEAQAAEKPKSIAPRKHSGLTGINAELAALYATQYAEPKP